MSKVTTGWLQDTSEPPQVPSEPSQDTRGYRDPSELPGDPSERPEVPSELSEDVMPIDGRDTFIGYQRIRSLISECGN